MRVSGQGQAYGVLKWIKVVKVRTRNRKSNINKTRVFGNEKEMKGSKGQSSGMRLHRV